MVIHIALIRISDRLYPVKYRLCTTGLHLGGLHSLQYASLIGLTHFVVSEAYMALCTRSSAGLQYICQSLTAAIVSADSVAQPERFARVP